VPFKSEAVNEERIEDQRTDDQPSEDQAFEDQSIEEVVPSGEMPIEASSDDEMEYVDDPQIDLLSA
jgi:hypothetical protein